MQVSDAKRLRALEAENAQLKKRLAESMLDNAVLTDIPQMISKTVETVLPYPRHGSDAVPVSG